MEDALRLKDLCVLVITGVLAGFGAFVFFYVTAFFNAIVSLSVVALYVGAFLSVVGPYIFLRFLGVEGGGGTELVLKHYHFYSGVLKVRECVGYLISSILTIGLGGSAGPEGPLLVYGAGIGSALSRTIKVRREFIRRFLLAGAAAGVSAAFKAPFTGILYALEVPYRRDLEASAFLYAIPASITGYLVSQALVQPHLHVPTHQPYVGVDSLVVVSSCITGLAAGAISLLFISVVDVVGRFSYRVGSRAPILAGATLVALVYFFPEVRGLGYEPLNLILNGALTLGGPYLIGLALTKILATAITVKGGGSGGMFLPSIFIGAMAGGGLAEFLQLCGLNVNSSLVITMMISAVLAASNKTLLTSIALTAEVLGFANLIPSLLASATAYVITLPWSLHKNQLTDRDLAMRYIRGGVEYQPT